MHGKIRVPIGRIIALLAKAVRFSRGGFTRAERRELGADLLELSGVLLEDALNHEGPDVPDRPDAPR